MITMSFSMTKEQFMQRYYHDKKVKEKQAYKKNKNKENDINAYVIDTINKINKRCKK